jgi:hypothetical protein
VEVAVERATAVEAAEQAAHWATQIDKDLAYWRDIERNTAARRDAARLAETE